MKPLVTDELWAAVEPLLPPAPPRRFRWPGRKRLDRRKVLGGILFVLKTGIGWDDLPAALGYGCGKVCRAALVEWQRLGVWPRLHAAILDKLRAADRIDWYRAAVDSATARSPLGGEATGPNPTDRRKLGTKHHVLVDGGGVPLAATTTGANRHDSKQFVPLLDAVPDVAGKVGRPRHTPERVFADRAYDAAPLRAECRARGIDPHLPRRRAPHGSGLGVFRWPVERTLGWLHQFRRLGYRRDRLLSIHQAFVTLACTIIALRLL
jgi:transposase